MPYKCPLIRKQKAKERWELAKEDPEYKKKKQEYWQNNKHKIKKKTKKEIAEYNKAYYAKNQEREKARALKDYYENHEDRKAKNARWLKENKEQRAKSVKAYRSSDEGKAKRCSYERSREASKIRATPEWLTEQHLSEIEEMYLLAKELQWLFEGQALHVDHIVPLKGKNVCGLHVPWNLQILTASENVKKSNKFTSS